jgi:hypothetical protein
MRESVCSLVVIRDLVAYEVLYSIFYGSEFFKI